MALTEITSLQPRVWRSLARAWKRDRLSGTLLFTGRDGYGHWPLAVALAALANCEEPGTLEGSEKIPVPCGTCGSCRRIEALNSEAVLFALPLPPHKGESEAIDQANEILDAKRHEPWSAVEAPGSMTIPIESARAVKRSLAIKPPAGLSRVAIFYMMEHMRAGSADALLKLTEEPPANTLIVLTSERPEALLPTIVSRALEFRLDPIPPSRIEEALSGRDYPAERVGLVSRMVEGSLTEALAMLAQPEEDETARRQAGFDALRAQFDASGPEAVALLAEAVDMRSRHDVLWLLKFWQSLIRDCLRLARGGNADDLTNVDLSHDLKRLSKHFDSPSTAAHLTEQIKITLADLRRNVHIPGALAALVLRMRAGAKAA